MSAELQGESGFYILPDAGFLWDKAAVTAAFLRYMTGGSQCTHNITQNSWSSGRIQTRYISNVTNLSTNVIHSATYENQYSRTNKLHCSLPVCYKLKASACFQHYLLIIRRHGIYNNWYIMYVLCQVAASWHNTDKIYQLLYSAFVKSLCTYKTYSSIERTIVSKNWIKQLHTYRYCTSIAG
jgi:hypothetical protein